MIAGGRSYEGYSEDPEIVASYAGPMVEGLQGKDGTDEFLNEEHVLATAKHFLGDGGTKDGIDQGDNLDSEEDFRDHHGAGYPPAIEAGVQTVMASFSSWHGEKMHGSKGYLTDVLKEQMGFNGFVVGDWNGHGQLPNSSKINAPGSINAGLDMYMAPDSWRGLYKNTLAQAKSGEISRERLEDAVRRILRVKFRLGLFDKPKPSERPLGGDWSQLGAPENLSVARQAVRESLVLLKNDNNLLPLSADKTILVAGNSGNDIGMQSGGWTYSWQGTGNSRENFPNGQSIFEGIQSAIEGGGGKAIFSADGSYSEKPDVAVVVFGEGPYAEFMGDRENVDYSPEDGIALLKAFKEAGIPTVSIFLSGRPLWVNPEINASDAFVAAWLPGSQGAGVADVIIRNADGSINFDFKGKLSFSWPRTAAQEILNRDDENYDPLFPYGYGLTYSDNNPVAVLSEDPGLERDASDKGSLFDKGKGVFPWSLIAQSPGQMNRVVDAVVQLEDLMVVQSVDRNAQEDAKSARWTGNGEATIALACNGVDLSREANGDMAIAFQFRVDKKPQGPVKMYVMSPQSDRTSLDVTNLFNEATVGEWTQIDIKLGCFLDAGAQFTEVTTIWGLSAKDEFEISFSEVRLNTNTGQAICP